MDLFVSEGFDFCLPETKTKFKVKVFECQNFMINGLIVKRSGVFAGKQKEQ